MKNKEYIIETVEDMINCTNENNIDNFLADLKNIILLNQYVEKINPEVVREKFFTWVDDNENNLTIELNTNKN